VLADGRLAQAEALGSLGQAPGLRDGQEGLKQDGIEHRLLSRNTITITPERVIHNERPEV
jgi:hypothetical protein